MPNKVFTVDLEEYYHAENILYSIPESTISALPGRLEIGARKILDALERTGNKATFFVLGCLARENKDLLREIVGLGHEIASHGYQHIRLSRHTPMTFETDLSDSINALSDITGRKIIGHRATSFSFSENAPWFFDTLKKFGIAYDSSMAYSLFRKCIHRIEERAKLCEAESGILEFPVSFIKIWPIKMPLGGGYFRACPYWLTRSRLRQERQRSGLPDVFYIHPWELDAGQPRFKIAASKYFRHYFNLGSTEEKLKRLLGDIKFVSFADFLKGNLAN